MTATGGVGRCDASLMLLRHSILGLRRSALDAARCSAAAGLASSFNEIDRSGWQYTPVGHQTRGLALLRKDEGLPLETGRQRLVILGTGWAAARLVRDINPKYFDFTVYTVVHPSAIDMRHPGHW